MGKNRKYNTRNNEKNTSDASSPHGRPPDNAHTPPEPDPETRPVSEEDSETASLSATSKMRTRATRPGSSQTATQGAARSTEMRTGRDKISEQTVRPRSGLGSGASMTL